MTLQTGERVGELTFLRPDGEPAALGDFPARALVLIFLRHLG